jgi:hypothetical protein
LQDRHVQVVRAVEEQQVDRLYDAVQGAPPIASADFDEMSNSILRGPPGAGRLRAARAGVR